MTTLLILTRPRAALDDPFSYLRETIAQVDREKITRLQKGIVCDGPYEGPRPPGWEIIEYQRPPATLQGNKLPYWHLLSIGHDAGGELIALEDDLTFCENAVRRMTTFLIPADLAWVQFFSPQVLMAPQMYPGLWRPPISSHLFLQCAKFTHETLVKLMEYQDTHPDWGMFNTSDQTLATATERLGLNYGVHSPDLVQHVGEASEANPLDGLNRFRVSCMWPGAAFDSLALYTADYLFR